MNLVRYFAPRVPGWALAFSLFLLGGPAFGSWVANGNQINASVVTNAGEPVPLSMAPDGRGGVYIASGFDLTSRLTRILDTGALAPGWVENGLSYFDGGYWPLVPKAIPDDAGGVYVISSDVVCFGHYHCTGNATFLRAHHANLDGTTDDWSREGIALGSGLERASDRRQAVSIPNGLGSVLTTWADPVGDYHYLTYGGVLRAQRVDITGALPWGPSGVVVRSALLRLLNQTMAPDGTGGAYVFWQDDRSPGIYGQHIAADGRALWTADGIPISLSPGSDPGPPVAVSDGSHGAFVAWSEKTGSLSRVSAAHVTPMGVLPLPRDQRVSLSGSSQVDGLRIVPTETGGAILAWRSVLPGAPDRIFAQHIDHAGRPSWSKSGVIVCEAQGTRDHLAIASDLRGGVYLAWIDSRPKFSIFGMHLDRSGQRVQGWSSDGEPICARIPLTTTADGTATVNDLQLATIVESAKPVPSLVDHLHARRDDVQASAMVVWVDDRSSRNSPFAMLLTPHGPAAPQFATPVAPILANQTDYIRASSPELSLSIGSTGTQTVKLSLQDASQALLEVFDIGGRRLWSREVGGLGLGAHEVRIGDGEGYPSGVYVARLTQGSHAVRAHVAVIH